METISQIQRHTLTHWINVFKILEELAAVEGLDEDQVISMAFESIKEGAADEHKLSNLLVEALDKSSFFSDATKLDFRNRTWENNQTLVMNALGNYIKLYSSVPNLSTLAHQAKLSRQTVAKHLKESRQVPGYMTEQLCMMRTEVLAKVCSLAMNGSLKAAKVYLDATAPNTTQVVAPTNFIQINNMKIDQVTFMNLPEPVRQQIGELIQTGIQEVPLQKVDKP